MNTSSRSTSLKLKLYLPKNNRNFLLIDVLVRFLEYEPLRGKERTVKRKMRKK